MPSEELHFVHRAGWLRASVLGANDGLISTASLIAGVAASAAGRSEILTAALAGWAAGAMAMAAGEYVSVGSQADSEKADIERERRALREAPVEETIELSRIYEQRGLAPALARQVAEQLMAKDALRAHTRDELGLADGAEANPIQAAFASGISFSAGAIPPTIAAFLAPTSLIVPVVAVSTILLLAILGAVGAWLGGAGIVRPALRVAFWGALALAVTAGIGLLVGKAI